MSNDDVDDNLMMLTSTSSRQHHHYHASTLRLILAQYDSLDYNFIELQHFKSLDANVLVVRLILL